MHGYTFRALKRTGLLQSCFVSTTGSQAVIVPYALKPDQLSDGTRNQERPSTVFCGGFFQFANGMPGYCIPSGCIVAPTIPGLLPVLVIQ